MNKYNYKSIVPIHPGETLEELLDYLNMTQVEFSHRAEMPLKTVNSIIKGKSGITSDMAVKFERILGTDASYWNNLQAQYEEAKSRQQDLSRIESQTSALENFPVYSELARWNYVDETRDDLYKMLNILKFFGLSSIDALPNVENEIFEIAFRKSDKEFNPYSLLAWLRAGELDMRKLELPQYNKSELEDLLPEFRKLTNERPEKYSDMITNLCSRAGVALVFTPYFKNTHVSGATRWVGNNPLIQLSPRYKRNDSLWFTLLHEIAHVLLHGKKDRFIESETSGLNIDKNIQKEKEANSFAQDTLIPKIIYSNFISERRYDAASIRSFAKKINISPDIVAWRLAREEYITYGQAQKFSRPITLVKSK